MAEEWQPVPAVPENHSDEEDAGDPKAEFNLERQNHTAHKAG